jgi:hypothetical protein
MISAADTIKVLGLKWVREKLDTLKLHDSDFLPHSTQELAT